MPIPLRVLVVEDNEDDALLVTRELQRGGLDVSWERVETREAMAEALDRGPWDLILSDFRMPRFSAAEALAFYRERGIETPFIIVSGTIGEEQAVASLKAGAHDFFLKDHLTRLCPAVERELREAENRRARRRAEEEQKQARAALARSEERFAALIEFAPDAMVISNARGEIVLVNGQAERLFGYRREELLGKPVEILVPERFRGGHPGHRSSYIANPRVRAMGAGRDLHGLRKDGTEFPVEIGLSPLETEEGRLVSSAIRDVTEQRRMTEALRQREAQLAAIYDGVGEPIYLLAVEPEDCFRLLSINDAFLAATGLREDQVVGKRIEEVLPESSHALVIGKYRQAMRERRRVDWEEVAVFPAGRKVGEVAVSPIWDDKGLCTHVVGWVRDVTEERQALDALRESEERYRGIVESQTDFIIRVDPGRRFTFVNEAFCRFVGRTNAELLGASVETIFLPEDEAERLSLRSRIESPPYRVHFELRVRTPGGVRWLGGEGCAILGPDGRITEIQSHTRDVTDARRAEEELRLSEARYRTQFEHAPEAIVTLEVEKGCFVEANPAAERLFAMSSADLFERHPAQVSAPTQPDGRSSVEAVRRHIERALAGERPVFEWTHRNAAEEDVPCEVRLVRLPGKPGQHLCRFSVVDIRERKRHEELRRRSEEMEEQNRRIQEANRLKSEFLANMSHELRTPLNAILGFAQLMHDGKVGAVSDPHREYLGDIVTSGRHLLQLVNDVLDLAKVESGKMEFLPELVELPKLVGEVRDILRTLAAEKRVFVETQVDPALTGAVTDPRRLKQILYNYLSNALKFTPEGGRATVRVGPEGPEALRLEVEDTGVGIRPEDLGRLFVEFQQLDTGAAKRHPGTGLGLALTRRIVEAQGGHVGVRSTPGKGSVFFAVLPRRPPTAAIGSEAGVRPRTAAPLVLVIEDEAKDRAWLEATLAGAGYAVEPAKTGGEALARCRETAFDAIVLDILLPDMSGWDALRAIRADGRNRDTPTIVVTVVAEKGAGVGFFIHDYLTKPVQGEDLLASLTRAGVLPGVSRPILVVEDEPSDSRLMEALLKQLGYRPVVRADGASGLQAAADEPPAAVVLDLVMPGMDGFEFLERFRRMGIGRRTPVIVWTAHDLTAAVLSRLKDSAQAVVEKSRGAEALLEELRAHVLPPRAAGDAGEQPK